MKNKLRHVLRFSYQMLIFTSICSPSFLNFCVNFFSHHQNKKIPWKKLKSKNSFHHMFQLVFEFIIQIKFFQPFFILLSNRAIMFLISNLLPNKLYVSCGHLSRTKKKYCNLYLANVNNIIDYKHLKNDKSKVFI